MSPPTRLCISLLHAPSRSSPQTLQRCAPISITARGDNNQQGYKRHQTRPFTLTPRRHAGSMAAARQVSMRQPSQPSIAVQMKAQQKAAMRDGSLLEQYGLLPGTVVPPTGSKLPSWLKDPRDRFALEWHKIKRGVVQMMTALYFSKWAVRPRFSLERGKVAGVAKELYEDMYRHFATGDLAPIEHRLSPGFMGSLRARISQRAPNTSLLWSLEKYLGQPQLIWYSVAMMDPKRPREDQTGILQAVVKIRSRQRLQKLRRIMGKDRQVREVLADAEGKEIHEDELERERRRSTKDTTEYVVLQRIVKKSRPGPWLIWGTTEEMTLAKMKRVEEQVYKSQVAARKGQ
ncbi:hypothetical protein M409DRAFT_51392 [Zasmidium cellare ATCC 36951]|uniref:Tim44-like domain-containing protein n=1 Tax=Zasmidium cellare ATCC 36951 TaxID=1080233 RepID=A0A6A6CST4_ZASCE|nr:uncharacterized protein M409DRAFT_51392 [Zasmidium cellare ATCC 36951]KAF2170337.1 hypothetical protein M409DRAFT_51392 [Zasmidium cellare ATCC 36951]